MKNKSVLIVLVLVVLGSLLLYKGLSGKKSSKKVIENPTIVNVNKKIRTKKFSDAKLVQVPMNSEQREKLLKGEAKKKEKQTGKEASKQESLESVSEKIKDNVLDQKESSTTKNSDQTESTTTAGSNLDVDSSNTNDQVKNSKDSVDSSITNEDVVTNEDNIVVETDGRQLLIQRNFNGDILECSGQTSWDSHHLYHPLPSQNKISIICETTSGFVVIDSDLNNL